MHSKFQNAKNFQSQNLDIHYLISGKSIYNCQYIMKKGSQHLYTKL